MATRPNRPAMFSLGCPIDLFRWLRQTDKGRSVSMSQNPLEQGPKPPHPAQQQDEPGLESRMDPRPDYGLDSYRGSGRLKGKAAIITGGDSGIGRAVALAFAREGADVLISYLNEE